MDSIPHASGIYQILCVPTGKIYIGSPIDLCVRWREHSKKLRGNRHPNIYLQRAWNKHGEASFRFAVVELVMFPEYLVEREQVWIDATRCTDQNVGFNICPRAGSALGRKALPGARNWKRENADTVEGYVDPDGNVVTIYNLWDFCKRMGLKHSAMWRLGHGVARTKSHKGWTHIAYPYKGRALVWKGFIDPNGTPMEPIYNLSEFCRKHGLSQSHMQGVYTGRRPHHRGWTCRRGDDGF